MGDKANLEPALCRCCGSLTKFRILNENYYNSGQNEVYSDMIKDCFGFEMSKLDGELEERLICAPCMLKLREAWAFRLQVQETEQRFLKKLNILPGPGYSLEMYQAQQSFLVEDSDGFDDELDPEQLAEYYSLGNGIEPQNSDGYSSDDDGLGMETNAQTRCLKKRSTVKKKPADDLLCDKKYIENATTIVMYSHACPFKNRFNHIMCYYCGQYFLNPEHLRDHTLTHKLSEFKYATKSRYLKIDITRIDCKLCPKKIDTIDDFKEHLINVHKKLYYPRSKDGVIPFKLVPHVNSCSLCGEDFQQFHSLVRHMDQHFSNYVCETCGMGFMDRTGWLKHAPNHGGQRFECKICASSLKSLYSLQFHMRRQHGKTENGSDLSDIEPTPKQSDVEAACHGCDQTFKSRKCLATHIRKVHLNYRHVCHVCGQKFFARNSLNNHMPTHTGERNFKCKVCGKSYPRVKTLREHMRIHNNDRRYSCTVCGQAFIQNCSLKGHMKSKHPEYNNN